MSRSTWFRRLLIGVAAIAVLLVWQGRHDANDAPPVPSPAPLIVPSTPQAAAPADATTLPAPAMPYAGPPLTEQVEALMATRDPAKAYAAYRLVRGCADFNLLQDRVVFEEAAAGGTGNALPGFRAMSAPEKQREASLCGGMSERQRLSRLDYLAPAARAGVPGAAEAFASEGPFGDPTALASRPQDPLVQEWKRTAIGQLTAAAESGTDIGAVAYLASAYGAGSALIDRNLLLAYRYRTAASLIDADMGGPAASPGTAPTDAMRRWEGMVAHFAPEQRAAELAAARAIAARAREHRRRLRDAPP